MKTSTDFVVNKSRAFLCVAEPKSGKSRLGFAFPYPGILDCDDNLAGAIESEPTKPFLVSQPFMTDDGKEVPEDQRWLRAMSETKALLADPRTQSFFLDGLSNLCRWGLIYAENELIKAGINVKKEYLAKYAAFIPLISNYMTMIRIPKKPVIVSVHQTLDKDELSGKIRFKLDIPGRLADNLGGQFTDVIAMDAVPDPGSKVGAKYFIRTKPTGYHPNLGTSMNLEPSIDVTGKTPSQIWALLAPKLATVTPTIQPTK